MLLEASGEVQANNFVVVVVVFLPSDSSSCVFNESRPLACRSVALSADLLESASDISIIAKQLAKFRRVDSSRQTASSVDLSVWSRQRFCQSIEWLFAACCIGLRCEEAMREIDASTRSKLIILIEFAASGPSMANAAVSLLELAVLSSHQDVGLSITMTPKMETNIRTTERCQKGLSPINGGSGESVCVA